MGEFEKQPTIPDVFADMAARLATLERIAANFAPDFVAALPSSPLDGYEIYYADAAMQTAGIAWHLRYNNASASAYKWEFLGGAPFFSEVTTSQGISTTTYADLATVGPSVTLPVAGDYDVEWGTRSYLTTAGVSAMMGISIGGAAVVAGDEIDHYSSTVTAGASDADHESRCRRKAALASGAVLLAKYKSGTGGVTAQFLHRYLKVTPVRVG